MAAWVRYMNQTGDLMMASSFILVLGPVGELSPKSDWKDIVTRGDGEEFIYKGENIDLNIAPQHPSTRGDGKEDGAAKWPALHEVKQKAPSP